MVSSAGKRSTSCDWFKAKGRSAFVMTVKSVLEEVVAKLGKSKALQLFL